MGAERQARESLALAREMGDQRWTAANLNCLSRNYLALNEWRTAERYAQEALTITHEIQSENDALGDIACLARAWAYQGKVEPALRVLFFVDGHPSTILKDRTENASLLHELRAELPPALVADALSWAAYKTLDEVAQWVKDVSNDPARS